MAAASAAPAWRGCSFQPRLLFVSGLILICFCGTALGQKRNSKYLTIAVEDLDVYNYLRSQSFSSGSGPTLNFTYFPVRGHLSTASNSETVQNNLTLLRIDAILSDYYTSLAIASKSEKMPYFLIRKFVTTPPPLATENIFSVEIGNSHLGQALYDLSVEYQRSSLFIVSDGSDFSSDFVVKFPGRVFTMSIVWTNSSDEELFSVFAKFSPNALTSSMGWVLLFDEPNLPLMERTLVQASRAGVFVASQYFFVPSLFDKQSYLTRFYRSDSQIFTFFLPGRAKANTQREILRMSVVDCLKHYQKSYNIWRNMQPNDTIKDALVAESSIEASLTGTYSYDPVTRTRNRVHLEVYRANASRPASSIFSLAGNWSGAGYRTEAASYRPYYDGADVVSQSLIKFVAFRSLPYFYDYNASSGTARGLSVEIVEAMKERLGFKYTLIEAANEYDAVQMLNNGTADVSINFLEPTVNRLAFLDASVDVVQDGIQMMNRKVVHKTDFLNVFYPFSFYVWMSIVLGIILLSATLYISDRISPNTEGKPVLTPFESFFLVLSSFLMSKVENEPTKVSSRIFTILLWFATLMYMTTYLSNLVAFLIQSDGQIIVSNVPDLQDITSYKWGWVRNPTFDEEIRTTWPELYARAQSQWPDQMYYDNIQDALEKVLSDANFILLANADVLSNYKNTNCALLVMGNIAKSRYNTWLFRKRFRFMNELNGQLRERKDTDFAQLRSKYFDLKRCYSGRTDIANKVPLGFEYLCGLFALLGIGIGLAFLQLLIRWIYRQLSEWSRLSNQGIRFKQGEVYQAEVYDTKPNGVWVRIEGDTKVSFLDNSSLYLDADPITEHSNSILLGKIIQVKFVANCGASGARVFQRQPESPHVASTCDSDNSEDGRSYSTGEDSV